MRTLLALLAAVCLIGSAHAAKVLDVDALNAWIAANQRDEVVPVPPPPPPEPNVIGGLPGYHLTFADEFNDLSISNSITHDGARWYSETEPCCMPGGNPNYRSWPHVIAPTTVDAANPFSIQDGALRIRLTKVNNVWYGGSIATTDRDNLKGFAQTYGFWEARMKIPIGSGPWASFWAKSQARTGPLGAGGMYTQKGEIDIMEIWGAAPAMWVTLHDWVAKTAPGTCKAKSRFDFYTDFHTYGMKWDGAKMSFFFDGEKVCELVTPAQMKQPYYAILDLGMGGGYPVDQTPNPSDLLVDYVRIWAK